MARTANIKNEEPRTTEVDMTEAEAEEVLKADMAANEMDYLTGLLDAAEDAEEETKSGYCKTPQFYDLQCNDC